MNNKQAKDKLTSVLEKVIEVLGIVLMLAPLFQSKGRRKSK